ncbi:NAD(P)-dependent oxidoreductase [Roseibium sp. RKSG952]|uniref:NAD-dependent epimerase/dehydratase family protein n=1 Tax=Roseibium sp. RKSG952 TaxID=2529384 RepID=UPI0012BC74B2|nr:NAD(P)-dependent oxidoreductase [Roseibium sp. RKSG952]MTI00853.1 NAD(P)-dependent oxidoreductase [Roseibium sp. RKSG952]
MTRVLITGATGFIGSHLVRTCLTRGDDVTALVRPSSSLEKLSDVSSSVEVVRAELTDVAYVQSIFETCQPQVVFHAAAQIKVQANAALEGSFESVQENLLTLLGVLKAATVCKSPPRSFIRLGTNAEYGGNPVPYVEAQREQPRDSYGASMLAGTKYLEMLRLRLPFTVVTARLSLTYGPGQTGTQLVPYLVDNLLRGQAVHIERPDDVRDFIHVNDVVRALLLLADNPSAGSPVINIGTGTATKVRDVVEDLVKLTGAPAELIEYGSPPGPVMKLVNDPSLIKSRYPWAPKTALKEGLRDTVEWSRNVMRSKVLTGQSA